MRRPDDRRTLVVGLGMQALDTAGAAFFDLIDLVQEVL
jgi:hypothetical protein